MAGFIFGGNTGETPESLKRKRSIAEALAATNRAPRDVGEGLTAVGNALVYRALMGDIGKGEAAGQKSLEADRAAFMGGFGGGAPASSGGPSASIPMTDAAGEVAATSPTTGDTYAPFMDTIKAGGVDNPYALAAIAATGRAESGWDGKKAVSTWSDPSESGQPGTSGGIMSWRGPRYQALAAAGDMSPQGQAKFFLQEDPALIQKLNGAKSLEEAQGLMNNAWAFAGYNRPGGESARRLGYAKGYLSSFQGGGAEVASLDPSIGMPPAAAAIEAAAPASGYVDPMVSAPNSRRNSPVAAALAAEAPAAPAPSGRSPVAAALASPTGAPQQPLPVGEMASTTNPARPSSGGVTVAQALGNGPSVQQAFKLLNNPYATEADKAMATMVIKQHQDATNPDNQLDREYKRAQLDALRAKPGKNWQKLDDTTLFNPETGETQSVGPTPASSGGFRFEGKSVEAQALNGLMDAGTLTPAQAQQLGAGKTITGPNGEIIFMTPQGVFGQSADGTVAPVSSPQPPAPSQPPSPPGDGVDIFGDRPSTMPAPAQGPSTPTPPAPPSPPVPPQPQRNGMIPLTEPKVTIDESKAGGFADRMTQSGALVDKYGNAGLSTFDQTITNSPYVPGFIANNLVGDDFQQYDQARRDFINAQLRRESGAVISPEEFDNANRQYFPQPGDKPEVLEQKRKNRETVIGAMIRDAGPTYKKPAAAASGAPTKGTVEGGYRFKGGDPADQSNWEKVQ